MVIHKIGRRKICVEVRFGPFEPFLSLVRNVGFTAIGDEKDIAFVPVNARP